MTPTSKQEPSVVLSFTNNKLSKERLKAKFRSRSAQKKRLQY